MVCREIFLGVFRQCIVGGASLCYAGTFLAVQPNGKEALL